MQVRGLTQNETLFAACCIRQMFGVFELPQGIENTKQRPSCAPTFTRTPIR